MGSSFLTTDDVPPLKRIVLCHEPEAVIDPVRQHDTARDQSTLEEHQETPDLRWRDLGLPDWNRAGVHTISRASHYATNDQLCECERRSLNRSSDEHDQGSNQHCSSSSEFVAVANENERPHQAADFIDGDDQCLDGAGLVHGLHLWELLQEHRLRDDAAHDTLCRYETRVSDTSLDQMPASCNTYGHSQRARSRWRPSCRRRLASSSRRSSHRASLCV